jgi:hypothetical protein
MLSPPTLNTLRTGRIILCFSLLNVADWSHNIMLFAFKRGGLVAQYYDFRTRYVATHYTLLWHHTDA